MEKPRLYTAIGLMSGTSLDGIDAALIRTDGHNVVETLESVSIPYDDELRQKLRACLGRAEDDDGSITRTEIDMTRAHAAAVDWLLSKSGQHPAEVDVIGFHGQTIFHDPANGFTWQIGNGSMLARLSSINVVNDFRSADVEAGGEGAPLIPVYHQALAAKLEKPVVVLNIGGVSNITYLGAGGDVLAFDTGPGNALLDDWVTRHTDRDYDAGGMLARQGAPDETLIAQWMEQGYFSRVPPKSLDRDEWNLTGVEGFSPADGAATLAHFTVKSIGVAREHFPTEAKNWYVTGGGRHNDYLMELLALELGVQVGSVNDLGWDGDMLEAEGFAYLAVRHLEGLPLSLPTTTGVLAPQAGGRFFDHKQALEQSK